MKVVLFYGGYGMRMREESLPLSLRYVRNGSLAMDAVILWKTASAVLRGNGAC